MPKPNWLRVVRLGQSAAQQVGAAGLGCSLGQQGGTWWPLRERASVHVCSAVAWQSPVCCCCCCCGGQAGSLSAAHQPPASAIYQPTEPPSLQTSELEAEVAQLQNEITQLRQQYGKAQREVAAANQAEREARVVLSKAKSKQARAGRAGGIGCGSGQGKTLGR